jgi:hypothetical protein
VRRLLLIASKKSDEKEMKWPGFGGASAVAGFVHLISKDSRPITSSG